MSEIYTKVMLRACLEAQLPLLQLPCDTEDINDITIHDVIRIVGGLSSVNRVAFTSIWTAMKLLLVMPATNTSSERSVSALRRIKTYHLQQ